jgi:methanogenic corrinoid protein MtbC1
MSEQLKQALSDLEEETVLKLVQERLDSGDDPMTIVADCREGMAHVGKRYEDHEYYVSDLIMAAEIFKQAMALIGAKFKIDGGANRGTVVIGTVQGDIHDIGKDIVVSLLQAGGYHVVDLGVDVPPARFVEAVKESGAAVAGLSGLLTISFGAMRETVEALSAAGLRSEVKVMVGGGTVTEQVRAYVGADALGTDAQAAVALCNRWI